MIEGEGEANNNNDDELRKNKGDMESEGGSERIADGASTGDPARQGGIKLRQMPDSNVRSLLSLHETRSVSAKPTRLLFRR